MCRRGCCWRRRCRDLTSELTTTRVQDDEAFVDRLAHLDRLLTQQVHIRLASLVVDAGRQRLVQRHLFANARIEHARYARRPIFSYFFFFFCVLLLFDLGFGVLLLFILLLFVGVVGVVADELLFHDDQVVLERLEEAHRHAILVVDVLALGDVDDAQIAGLVEGQLAAGARVQHVLDAVCERVALGHDDLDVALDRLVEVQLAQLRGRRPRRRRQWRPNGVREWRARR